MHAPASAVWPCSPRTGSHSYLRSVLVTLPSPCITFTCCSARIIHCVHGTTRRICFVQLLTVQGSPSLTRPAHASYSGFDTTFCRTVTPMERCVCKLCFPCNCALYILPWRSGGRHSRERAYRMGSLLRVCERDTHAFGSMLASKRCEALLWPWGSRMLIYEI